MWLFLLVITVWDVMLSFRVTCLCLTSSLVRHKPSWAERSGEEGSRVRASERASGVSVDYCERDCRHAGSTLKLFKGDEGVRTLRSSGAGACKWNLILGVDATSQTVSGARRRHTGEENRRCHRRAGMSTQAKKKEKGFTLQMEDRTIEKERRAG